MISFLGSVVIVLLFLFPILLRGHGWTSFCKEMELLSWSFSLVFLVLCSLNFQCTEKLENYNFCELRSGGTHFNSSLWQEAETWISVSSRSPWSSEPELHIENLLKKQKWKKMFLISHDFYTKWRSFYPAMTVVILNVFCATVSIYISWYEEICYCFLEHVFYTLNISILSIVPVIWFSEVFLNKMSFTGSDIWILDRRWWC